jgi:hypothetical protein
VGAIGAGIGWATTEFLARPIRKFFDLRGETIRMVSQYANLPTRFHTRRIDNETMTLEGPDLSEPDLAKLREAQGALRALAAQMRGFAYNETMANRVLRWIGFDPKRASEGLFGIANTVDTTGEPRVANKKIVTEALRLPKHIL